MTHDVCHSEVGYVQEKEGGVQGDGYWVTPSEGVGKRPRVLSRTHGHGLWIDEDAQVNRPGPDTLGRQRTSQGPCPCRGRPRTVSPVRERGYVEPRDSGTSPWLSGGVINPLCSTFPRRSKVPGPDPCSPTPEPLPGPLKTPRLTVGVSFRLRC